MNITFEKRNSFNDSSDLAVLFLSASTLKGGKSQNSSASRILIRHVGPHYRDVLKQLNFSGNHGQPALIPSISKKQPLLLVIGIDIPESDSTRERLERIRYLAAQVVKEASRLSCTRIEVSLENIWVGSTQPLEAFWEGLVLSAYRFRHYKTNKKSPAHEIKNVSLLSSRSVERNFPARMRAICNSVIMARDLINTPANDLLPSSLARFCQKSAREHGLSVEIFDKKKLMRIGAGGILCVGMGSDDQSYLAKITYTPRGARPKKQIALVGKAITFDCGGLSIKTSMDTMKCDMSGGAAILATMCSLRALKVPLKVTAYIPIAENMINGKAMRPGDIFTLLNGKTVEVLNTDAEGRLILADALTLAQREKPDLIIDLATLTGACVVALGSRYAGLFCNNRQLARILEEASDLSGEPIWQLPLAREYHKLIFSDVADYKNLFKDARCITAALFLEEFVNKVPWAHLDIAGPAFTSGSEGYCSAGGVGFGVRTLIRALEIFAENESQTL